MKLLFTALLLLSSYSAHALECSLTCQGITAESQRILDAKKKETFNEFGDVNCRSGGSVFGVNPILEKASFTTVVTESSVEQATLRSAQVCQTFGEKLGMAQATPSGPISCSGTK